VALVYEVRPESVAESLRTSAITGLALNAVLVSGLKKHSEQEMCAHYETATFVVFDQALFGSYSEGFPTVQARLERGFSLWVN